MREILIRGKRIDNGECVCGYILVFTQKKNPYIQMANIGTPFVFENDVAVEVDPSTVGQFTGLTDKNGKKIFEGDIVKVENTDHDWHEHDPNSYNVFAVSFDKGGFTAGDYFLQNWLWFDGFHGEVIGNIYDNSELIEDKP